MKNTNAITLGNQVISKNRTFFGFLGGSNYIFNTQKKCDSCKHTIYTNITIYTNTDD